MGIVWTVSVMAAALIESEFVVVPGRTNFAPAIAIRTAAMIKTVSSDFERW